MTGGVKHPLGIVRHSSILFLFHFFKLNPRMNDKSLITTLPRDSQSFCHLFRVISFQLLPIHTDSLCPNLCRLEFAFTHPNEAKYNLHFISNQKKFAYKNKSNTFFTILEQFSPGGFLFVSFWIYFFAWNLFFFSGRYFFRRLLPRWC